VLSQRQFWWAFSLASLELEIAVVLIESVVAGFEQADAPKMELRRLDFLMASTLVVDLASLVL
jgi:hypothetical protein